MTEEIKKPMPKENKINVFPKKLNKEETKQFLTPFAFKLDHSLFGVPLAAPWRRGTAISIDLILIAMLSEMPGEILAFVIAITLIKLGSKARAEKLGKIKGRKRRAIMRYVGAFLVFIFLVDTLPDWYKEASELFEGATNIEQVDNVEVTLSENIIAEDDEFVKALEIQLADSGDATDGSSEVTKPVYSFMKLVSGIIDDLGLGFGWAAFYFTIFTAIWYGQTPGKRLLGIRVLQLDGTPLSISDSFGRYGGYGAGIATGLLGFLQIYWDPNRQAIHDKISATVVVYRHNHNK